jgi:hypothetical protein
MKKFLILCSMVALCIFIWTSCKKDEPSVKLIEIVQDDVTLK